MESQSPKSVLNELLRVLENRRSQMDELLVQVKSINETIGGLQTVLSAMQPKLTVSRVTVTASDPSDEILAMLDAWSSSASEDCSLPELHRRLSSKPSLGSFHDALRKLHRTGRIELHPWTGPLYTLPDPACALLVGHEVAYYASSKVKTPRFQDRLLQPVA
jgi:hypothetical protein